MIGKRDQSEEGAPMRRSLFALVFAPVTMLKPLLSCRDRRSMAVSVLIVLFFAHLLMPSDFICALSDCGEADSDICLMACACCQSGTVIPNRQSPDEINPIPALMDHCLDAQYFVPASPVFEFFRPPEVTS